MSLPGYKAADEHWQNDKYEEEDQDSYPEWHGDRDGKYNNWYTGDYYGEDSGKRKNAS